MSKFKLLPILAGVAVSGALTLVSSPVGANPFQIAVCGNPCTTGGDPNPINPAGFNIQVEGSNTVTNPMLEFIAEPNFGGVAPTIAPTLSVPSMSFTGVDGTTYGITTSNGLTGTKVLLSFSGNDAYGALSLAGADNSEKYASWLSAAGFTSANVPSYTIYAVAVDISGLTWSGTNGLFDLENTETGSIVFAYGCTTVTGGVCSQGDNTGSTPFTNAGLVPAPAIGHGLVVFLAIGGVLFGGKLLENLKKRHLHAA
jgi:hypothetical protein